jgi:hypothetical protein
MHGVGWAATLARRDRFSPLYATGECGWADYLYMTSEQAKQRGMATARQHAPPLIGRAQECSVPEKHKPFLYLRAQAHPIPYYGRRGRRWPQESPTNGTAAIHAFWLSSPWPAACRPSDTNVGGWRAAHLGGVKDPSSGTYARGKEAISRRAPEGGRRDGCAQCLQIGRRLTVAGCDSTGMPPPPAWRQCRKSDSIDPRRFE